MPGAGGRGQVPQDRHRGGRPNRQADPGPVAGGGRAGLPLLLPGHEVLEPPGHGGRYLADVPGGVGDTMSVVNL